MTLEGNITWKRQLTYIGGLTNENGIHTVTICHQFVCASDLLKAGSIQLHLTCHFVGNVSTSLAIDLFCLQDILRDAFN